VGLKNAPVRAFDEKGERVLMKTPRNGFSVKSHFEGKGPSAQATYDRLLQKTRQFGRVSEEPKKTSIHLVNRTAFAGVVTRKGAIILTVKSDRQLSSPRIHRSERTSSNRFHHEVKLGAPSDVDAELLKWLKDAYELSA
jgi:hypothetical protein